MKKELIEKYLGESTFSDSYPDAGGIAGDDDFPPGNIVFGQKFKKAPYRNRLTGYDKVWDVDAGDWKWDEFENSKGMEDPDSYSETLKKLSDVVPNFDFYKRLKRKVPKADVITNYDRSPQTRDPDTQLGKDDVEVAEVPDDIKESRGENVMRFKDYLNDLLEGEIAGWIAIYGGKKLEIKKSEATGIYGAKQIAIKKLNVPKSKQGLLAIEPAYD